MRRWLEFTALVLAVHVVVADGAAAFGHDHRHDDPSLRAIKAAHHAGTLDANAAIMLAARRVFDPDSMPAAYDVGDGASPIRCGTPIVKAALEAPLSSADRAQLEAWLRPTPTELARRVAYVTPEGHFELDYFVNGTNAVPLEDVDPANGVPDFVERVGQYFEESWQREFVELGFTAPDLSLGPYRVMLRRIGAYGFAGPSSEGSAGTEITVHHNFLNFPANDDPDGNQLGAAKVTAAHELKHASQFTNNGWSESGLWIEIDATWVEDIVYDQVNDYYNYITFRSPISDPPRALDDGGSGAYAECVWQHWMSETWGVGAIGAFWFRRAAAPDEDVMASYAHVLAQFGAPLESSFADFAAWNASCGDDAIAGYGYEEAAGYPTAPLTDESTSLPHEFAGSVDRLAAHLLQARGFTADEPGVVTLTPQWPVSSPLRARVRVERRDGSVVVESITLENDVTAELTTPLPDVAAITVVLAHGDLSQGPAVYALEVDEEIRRPVALPFFGDDAVRSRVAAGGTSSRAIALENVGAEGSVLDYEAVVLVAPLAAPSISGSTLSVDQTDYVPGHDATLYLEVHNRSIDFEWLQSVSIDFPAGVRVLEADDFLAPEARRLVVDGTTGEGVTVTWNDPDGAWGNVRNGESAVARIALAFDAALFGELVIPYTLQGDGFGSGSSTVESAVRLSGPASPLYTISVPPRVVRSGDAVEFTWSAAVEDQVILELSRDGGTQWESLTGAVDPAGSFTWTANGPTSFDAVVRVRNATDPTAFGLTPSTFVIAETVPWASVIAPIGTLDAGSVGGLEVAFDAGALDAGIYAAQLALVYDGMDGPALVPVKLDVVVDGTSTRTPTARGIVHGARPNPFNPTTHVAFTLFRSSHVRIDVFDARGRHVRRLMNETRDAGEHSVAWTGVDASGRTVASGVYLYVVDLEGEVQRGKVDLVK